VPFHKNIPFCLQGGDPKFGIGRCEISFQKPLCKSVLILNIFGEIKGENPNLELEDVKCPFKNPYIKSVHFEHFW